MSQTEDLFIVFKNSVTGESVGEADTDPTSWAARSVLQTYGPQATVHLKDSAALRHVARHVHTTVCQVLFKREANIALTDQQRAVYLQYFQLAEFEDWVAFQSATFNPSGTEAEVRFLVAEDGTIAQKHLTLYGDNAGALKSILVKDFLTKS